MSGSSALSMAAWVRSRLNSASSELSLGRLEATFSDCERASSSRMVERRRPRSCRISAAKHFSSRSRPSSHALQFVIAADERIERVVHGGLGQVASELGQQRAFLGAVGGALLGLRTGQLFANGGEAQAALVPDLGGEAFLFAQQAQQQVLGADVLVIEALGLFGAIGQDALAFVAQRQIHGGGNLFANGGMAFDLLANGFDGRVRPQEAVGKGLVLAQQAQEQMLGFNIRTAELAGLIAGEKDHPPGLLRITFKHDRDAPYY